ncbi:MAG TPA: hypothetical protein VE262_20310 [Blastocatellia bacterium]|nr:hypothetical protein [Blastocatellia bacterium]
MSEEISRLHALIDTKSQELECILKEVQQQPEDIRAELFFSQLLKYRKDIEVLHQRIAKLSQGS